MKAKGINLKLIKALTEIQTLAGRAKGAYLNDRDPMRADHVIQPLDEIFELCLEVRSLYESTDNS